MNVALQVRATESLQAAITQELTRQLEQIEGVRVADADSDIIVNLIATELKTRDGRSTGLAVSWVAMEPLDPSVVDKFVQSQGRAFVKLLLCDYHRMRRQRQLIVGDGDIRKLAAQVVGDLNNAQRGDPPTAAAAVG
jgi:hypothetical protein